jgi:hypothetical protein
MVSGEKGPGRDGHCWPPLAQIRTRGITRIRFLSDGAEFSLGTGTRRFRVSTPGIMLMAEQASGVNLLSRLGRSSNLSDGGVCPRPPTEATSTLECCNWSRTGVLRKHANGRSYGSAGHRYDRRMTAPLLRYAPLATSRGHCHGINDEHLRRGTGDGSPLSFLEIGDRHHISYF